MAFYHNKRKIVKKQKCVKMANIMAILRACSVMGTRQKTFVILYQFFAENLVAFKSKK